jgi:GNAT superfamily N-acetyltransferase
MSTLPPGWATDLAVLALSGSTVEDRGDHLVLRTPSNPTFHWGHCLLVTDPHAVDDAGRWAAAFAIAFPDADWLAIGLARMPDDVEAWGRLGLEVELDEVLTTATLPRQTEAPAGYAVRYLQGTDWDLSIARAIQENAATGEYDAEEHARFVRARAQTQRDLCDRGVAVFVGAFEGDALVAELGIVRCGERARYQHVGTDEQHRGRGLASHLLGVAARWAAGRGCTSWVIVTEAMNPAGRVYRRAGFAPDTVSASAYRPPPA